MERNAANTTGKNERNEPERGGIVLSTAANPGAVSGGLSTALGSRRILYRIERERRVGTDGPELRRPTYVLGRPTNECAMESCGAVDLHVYGAAWQQP